MRDPIKLTTVERSVCALLLLLLTISCAPVSAPATVQPTATLLPSSTPTAAPTETTRPTDTSTITSTPTDYPVASPTPTLIPFAVVKQTFGPFTISNAANVYVTQPIVVFRAQGDFEVSFGLTSPDIGNDTGNGNARNTFTLDLNNGGRIYVAHNGGSWILGVVDPDGTINRSNLGTETISPAGMFTLRVLKDRAVANALVEGVQYATLPIDKLQVFDSSTTLTAGVQSAPHAVNIITGMIAVPQTQETNVALSVPTPLPTSTPTRRPAPPAATAVPTADLTKLVFEYPTVARTLGLNPQQIDLSTRTGQRNLWYEYAHIMLTRVTVWTGTDAASGCGILLTAPEKDYFRFLIGTVTTVGSVINLNGAPYLPIVIETFPGRGQSQRKTISVNIRIDDVQLALEASETVVWCTDHEKHSQRSLMDTSLRKLNPSILMPRDGKYTGDTIGIELKPPVDPSNLPPQLTTENGTWIFLTN